MMVVSVKFMKYKTILPVTICGFNYSDLNCEAGVIASQRKTKARMPWFYLLEYLIKYDPFIFESFFTGNGLLTQCLYLL